MPPPNSSSTGGFLTPTSRGATRTDLELENLIHDWIVGLTAMDPALVRPAFQPDPPPIPDFAVTWCAFYVTRTVSDWDPVVQHWAAGDLQTGDTVFRNQRIELTLTFYGPASGDLALDFRMASGIPQNDEALDDVKLVAVEDQVTTSEVIKGRWQRRVDVPVVLRRAVQFTYAVEDVASAYGSVYSDDPPVDWLASPGIGLGYGVGGYGTTGYGGTTTPQ
jgi:hypothetical protein